jgi:hypothetical protein
MSTLHHPASSLYLLAGALLAGLTLAGPAAAQQQLFSVIGFAEDDYFGGDVAPAGDINADGTPDLIVGAPSQGVFPFRTGAAYALSGKGGALLWTWYGVADFDVFGASVAGVGDINKDGHADVIVGVPLSDLSGPDAGRAVVYSGKTGAVIYNLASAPTGAHFGGNVTGLGDINGDTWPDFAVSAPTFAMISGFPIGRIYVYSGATGGLITMLTGVSASGSWGDDIADAGDVNGDGVHDLVIGEPYLGWPANSTGRIEVRSGANLATTLFAMNGLLADEALGISVAAAGDVNDDGFADVIAGGYYANGHKGLARVLLGPAGAASWVFQGDATNDHFGGAVDGVGDIDKDGHDDLLVGAYQSEFITTVKGYARLYSGRTGQQLYATLRGEALGDAFGVTVCGVGDVTGDGWLDIAVGAQASDANGEDSGKVYVYDALLRASNLGFGGPGSAQLAMYGSALDDFGQMDLALSGAKPNAPSLLIASPGTSFLAFKGGVIVPNMGTGVVIPLTTNGSGKITIPGILGGFGPVSIAIQYVIKDAAQPLGFAMSNAVSAPFLP